jgi:hypothetical protein
VCGGGGGVGVWGWGGWGVFAVWGPGVGSLLTFDIPQTALVATLDTYDFYYHYYMDTQFGHLSMNIDKDVVLSSHIRS